MPTNPNILGFGNRWFAKAFKVAAPAVLPSGRTIRVLPAAYFLATKLEAFDHRGAGDYVLSRDMEDLVAVIDGRTEIVGDILNADEELRLYLANRMSELIGTSAFLEALPGFLPPDAASQARSRMILERIKQILAPPVSSRQRRG